MKFRRLALFLFLTGCVAIRPPAFQATESRSALVNWRHGSDSLTADVTLQKNAAKESRLIASKGTTLLVLTQSGSEWIATGPLARGGWRGKASHAPAPLTGWICFAKAACGKVPAREVECAAAGDHFRAIY